MKDFFFTPKYTKGKDTVPSPYFSSIFQKNIKKYSDEIFKTKNVLNRTKKLDKKFPDPNLEVQNPNLRESISNSALRNFLTCPKKFAYTNYKLSVDRDFLLKGNLMHAFAEFYVNHREFVRGRVLEEFAQIILNKLTQMSNPLRNKLLKTEIIHGCKSLMEFIDNLKMDENLDFENLNSQKKDENIFVEYFKKPLEKINSEMKFKDNDLKLDGIIDLAANENLIIDYKTGKKKKVRDIIRNASIENITSNCDFQPLFYLSIFRKLNPQKRFEFWYNFPMLNMYEKIMEKELEENVVKVIYIPQESVNFIRTKEFFEVFFSESPKYIREILKNVEDFSFFEGITSDEMKNSQKFADEFYEDFFYFLISKGVTETNTNLKNTNKTLKNLCDFRNSEMRGQRSVYFFKDDLDKFENFSKENLNNLNEHYKHKFPFKPVDKDACKNCEFKKICLKS